MKLVLDMQVRTVSKKEDENKEEFRSEIFGS